MPINEDIRSLLAAKPDLTPDELAGALGTLREKKRAGFMERNKTGVLDREANTDFESYNVLDDPDFKTFLPQAIAHELKRRNGPSVHTLNPFGALPEPGSSVEAWQVQRDAGAGLQKGGELVAELGAQAAPFLAGGVPASVLGKLLLMGGPTALRMMKFLSDGKTQSLSRSAAEAATGGAVARFGGPVGALAKRLAGGKGALGSAAELAVGGLGGALQGAAPLMADPLKGDMDPIDAALLQGTLGVLGTAGRQYLGDVTARTGTRALERTEADLARPSTARRIRDARTGRWISPTAPAPEQFVETELQGQDVLNRVAKETGGAAEGLMRKLSQYRKASGNPQAFGNLPQNLEPFRGENAQKTIAGALDTFFNSDPNDRNALDQSAEAVRRVGKIITMLNGGDKQKSLETFYGYFMQKFFRDPLTGGAPADAMEHLSRVGGQRRVAGILEGIGLTPAEAKKAYAKIARTAQALDKINAMEKHANVGSATPRSAIKLNTKEGALSGGGFMTGVGDLVYGALPKNLAESVLRGKNPVLTTPAQVDLAKYFRRVEQNPNARSAGTAAYQSALGRVIRGNRSSVEEQEQERGR